MSKSKKSEIDVPKVVKKPKQAARELVQVSGDELIAANFTALSDTVAALNTTLEMLVQKAESMAYHIIATEAILAELVATNGISLARVNARIRIKIAAGTDYSGNPDQAIDAAAAIVSPMPRR